MHVKGKNPRPNGILGTAGNNLVRKETQPKVGLWKVRCKPSSRGVYSSQGLPCAYVPQSARAPAGDRRLTARPAVPGDRCRAGRRALSVELVKSIQHRVQGPSGVTPGSQGAARVPATALQSWWTTWWPGVLMCKGVRKGKECTGFGTNLPPPCSVVPGEAFICGQGAGWAGRL